MTDVAVVITIPLRLIPGPEGWDSPAVDPDIPRFRWYAWIDLAADRWAPRPTPLSTIEWALGHALAQDWPLWWLMPDTESWQVHVAQIARVEAGGRMLLAGCLRSKPWPGGLDYNVLGRDGAVPAERWERCKVCAGLG